MISLVPVIASSILGIWIYVDTDSFTNAVLCFIWGGVLAVATEVRALRLRPAGEEEES